MVLLDKMPVGTVIWRNLSFFGRELRAEFFPEDRTVTLRIQTCGSFFFEPVAGFCTAGLVAFIEGSLSDKWNSVVLKRYNRNDTSVVVTEGPKLGDGDLGYRRFAEIQAQHDSQLLNAPQEERFKAAQAQVLWLNRVYCHRDFIRPENGRLKSKYSFVKFDGWKSEEIEHANV